MIDASYWVYDLETYPNIFTACFINAESGEVRQYEISDRRNDRESLIEFVKWLGATRSKGVGFNNLGFDYPVIHALYRGEDPYQKAQMIIDAEKSWTHMVWDNEQIFPQIDLYKIHHFDNQAKRTSLKDLEIVMRSRTVQDLPFPPGTILTHEQMDELHEYNKKDVEETLKFLNHSIEAITFRDSLSAQYGKNFTNFSDTKIGAEIFIYELERQGIEVFYRDATGRRTPRQTWRSQIHGRDVILPYIKLERPEFNKILDFFKNVTITNTRSAFGKLEAEVDGVTYVFGTGGIHGAVPNSIYRSDDEMVVEMRDVKSYYPNLSIRNGVYPEHLGSKFCEVYEQLYDRRVNTPKSDPINGALKLALNGTYGNSNNEYSPFYDPKFTMTITINGQLGLCMLVEQLIKVPNLKMINVNTDGVGFIYPRKYRDHIDKVCSWWENVTNLVLEREEFKSFFQRDVNNYIGVDENDKVVRKGAYDYKIGWHQNPSSLVVQKAVEAHFVHGIDVVSFILQHRDEYDFMIRAKVRRSDRLMFGDRETQRITRYFVANEGVEVRRIAPSRGKIGAWTKSRGVSDETYEQYVTEMSGKSHGGVEIDSNGVPHNPEIHTKNGSKYKESVTRMEAGYQCIECADVEDFDWSNVNYTYYINEAMKLIEPLREN